VQVDVLRSAARVLAVLICFRTAGALRAYQSARVVEPGLPDLGTMLLWTVIEQACDDARYEVDLLRGAEPYKFRFAGRQRDICRIEVAHGLRARWLLGAIRMLRRLRRLGRRPIGGRWP
jgi:CelD/BcsL family acetyltransferase involved in cellulose biosynthesis